VGRLGLGPSFVGQLGSECGLVPVFSADAHAIFMQRHHLSGKPGNVGEFDRVRKMSGILLKVSEM